MKKKRGDRYLRTDGYYYIYIPEHPYVKNGYVLEHRYIMENALRRYLFTNETVHHKDGNKTNNSLENLEVIVNNEHARKHSLMRGRLYVNLKCPVCEKIFTIPKNKSFLNKHNKLNCNCCSPKCRGKLSKEIQKFGLTDNIKKSINENFIEEYRVYSNE